MCSGWSPLSWGQSPVLACGCRCVSVCLRVVLAQRSAPVVANLVLMADEGLWQGQQLDLQLPETLHQNA